MPEKREIIKKPNNVLAKKAKDLRLGDIPKPAIQKLIADMKETLKSTSDGVGLAAPQVGELLRIFIVSDEAEEIDKIENKRWEKTDEQRKRNEEKPYPVREWNYRVFINPKVKNTSRKKIDGHEGCLSVPGQFGIVSRNEKITVEAYDEHGQKFTRGASKFVARVIQHELDHLEGKLFIDRMKRDIK